MRKIPDAFVEELRRRLDIVEVVSEYVHLRRSGRSYVGLCPFHNERTPSLSVSPDRQLYHCFGCGAGGTVIRFVMDAEGLTFTEAVIRLAERAQLPLPAGFAEGVPAEDSSDHTRLLQAHQLAAKLYAYILMNTSAGVQALTYLETRGFTRQTMVEFALGYAPAGTDTLVQFLRKRGFSPAELVAAGLAVELDGRVLDRFRHRVVIPIVDGQGRVVAFGGRALADDAKPKYLNSPETAVFHKSALLFNLHAARKAIRQSRTAVLMEGYMDVLTAWQAGVHNAVASMGTSLTEQHARLLRRYADRVVLAYDGDTAGREAARRALAVLTDTGLTVRVAQFPEGADPDDWVRQHGPAALHEQLQQACTEVQFLLAEVRRTANLRGEAGRHDFLRQALAILAMRATPVERESELRRLSQEFHLSLESLQDELRLVAKEQRGGQRVAVHEQRVRRSSVRLPPPPAKGYV
ncbi:MAG: DNA primase, partial [Alicyclobacillus sp.]|nr:DNA primase [Alicyclobacillus sp.]